MKSKMATVKFPSSRRKQRGFTLIEVLVTVLILSVGLLGLAGLQTVSIRNNHSAYLRSQAVQLAYDMADRVRANTLANQNLSSFDEPTATKTDSCLETRGCSESQMAANDVWFWQQELTRLLPAASGTICLDSTPDDGTGVGAPPDNACDGNGTTYAVKIWWNDDRSGAATPQRFVMSFRP